MENNTMRSSLKNKATQTKLSNFPTKVGKFCFLVIFLAINIASKAQNLVPNPSFEEYIICPLTTPSYCGLSEINIAPPWQGTSMDNSPDYMNDCIFLHNDCPCLIDDCIKLYDFMSKQKAKTGHGMSGFFLHDVLDTLDNLYDKEYIQVKLRYTLHSNIRYRVSFYVSLNEYSPAGIDKFQVYFSDTLVYFNQTDPPSWIWSPSHYMLNPQVSNTEYNIITDTANWIKIDGSFLANGTEQYLVIGNFTPFSQTNTITLKDVDPVTYFPWCYYFLDDIAVYPDSTPVYPANIGYDTCIYAGDTLTLGAPSRAEYLYQWYDGNGNLIDTSGSITVSPTQTTTYVLVQKDFKFDETRDTINVTVGNCTPIPDYSHFKFDIYPNPCNGQVKVRFNSKVPDGAVLKLYDMIGQEVSEYPLTGIENIATINLGELATAIYHATVSVPDGFRKSVKLVIIR